jgi:hypothetical protein
MTEYQQQNSLSLDTNVPPSGTGSATPEPASGGANYAAWQWETILATVLSIPIPDRTEATAQPWLTITNNGEGGAGSHLIWTAGWNSAPNSGAASIQVYLSPALYATGGAWDRFLNAPGPAMSEVAAGNYSGLPLDPQSFGPVRLALVSLASGLGAMAQQLSSLHHDTFLESSGFQGNMAQVVSELFDSLRKLTLSLHDQVTHPTPYSDAIGSAGDSATTFLTGVGSAYASWTQLPEHSPLGALVQLLTGIAGQDANGAYVISDPQNTPYGDLTTAGAWASVEQQAKNLWLGTLTGGGSGGFAGLDVLGRSALGKLVDQYATTTAVLKPVVGPTPPPIQPHPVPGGPHHTGSGNPPHGAPGPGGPGPGGPGGPGPGGPGPGHGAPGPGPSAKVATVSGPPGGLGGSGGGAGGFPAAGGTGTGGGGAFPPLPVRANASLLVQPGSTGLGSPGLGNGVLGSPGPGSTGPGGIGPTAAPGPQAGALLPVVALTTNVPVVGLLGGSPAGTRTSADGPAGPAGNPTAGELEPSAGLFGAIGAIPAADGPTGDPATRNADKKTGFTGTIGRRPTGSRPAAGGPAQHLGNGPIISHGTVPVAGFSLGRNPNGSVLQQSAVPAMAAKPPNVTSSSVNAQLVPAGGGDGGPTVSSMAGDAGGALGRGLGGTDGPMMMPPIGMGGMGGGGMGGGAGAAQERERLAYLPEDDECWGTEPELPEPSVGGDDHDNSPEPEFGSGPTVRGIGAHSALEASADTR